ncbi:MAG: hypothetical protein J5654_11900 [Victivallales bacterium]|nr:hypothetical protein [Victivallales bacterium]
MTPASNPIPFWRRWNDWHYCIIIALVVLAAFSIGCNYAFMMDWDDATFVVNNQHLAWTWENLRNYFTHQFLELYTPVPLVSLMFDHAFFGLNPIGYHLHNILLHTACALLLFAILRKLGLSSGIATLGALLWALSPQKVESVIWIAERKDVDCGLFAFASFLCFQIALECSHRRKRLALFCAAGVLGVLSIWSKPATVALPGIFIVYAMLYGYRTGRAAAKPVLFSFPAILFTLLAIGVSQHFTQTGVGHLERLWAIPLHNLFWYPLSALYPWRLNPIHVPIRAWHDIWGVIVAGVLATSGLLALARWRKIPWQTILCAALIIGGTTVPVLGLLRYTDYTHCDRYNYCVSAVVWAVVLPLLASLPWKKTWWLPTALTLLVGVFFIRTWCYLPYWETSDTFVAYIFHQPGVPNRKSYQMGINATLRTNNIPLLAVIRERMRTEPPPEGIYSAPPEDSPARLLDAHLTFVSGDFMEAYRIYEDIKQRSLALREKYVIPTELIQVMYQDLYQIYQQLGNSEAAQFYFQQLEKVNEYHSRQNADFPIGE